MVDNISVVIPSHNRENLIKETLDSILSQHYAACEIIVVDDGSTDDTPRVVENFAPRVRLIRNRNLGETVARNTGISEARGELIAFCDSDDLWAPCHLARMHALWRHEPRLNAAYANFRIVRDGAWQGEDKFGDAPAGFWAQAEVIETGRFGVFRVPIVREMVGFQPFFPSAMVARAAFLTAIGGWDPAVNRQMSQDFATALRVAENPPIGVVFEPTVGVRKHAGNFSGDVQKMNIGDAAMLEHVLKTRPSFQAYADLINDSIRSRRLAALDIAFSRYDFTDLVKIANLLDPAHLPPSARLKHRVARLPEPARTALSRLLLMLGTLRAGAGKRPAP